MYQNFMPCMDPKYLRCSNNTLVPSETMELARAYVPNQAYVGLLPLNIALKRGTVFPNIDVTYPRI